MAHSLVAGVLDQQEVIKHALVGQEAQLDRAIGIGQTDVPCR
jgi:hypothetical protein